MAIREVCLGAKAPVIEHELLEVVEEFLISHVYLWQLKNLEGDEANQRIEKRKPNINNNSKTDEVFKYIVDTGATEYLSNKMLLFDSYDTSYRPLIKGGSKGGKLTKFKEYQTQI